jgi:hypothetical protein
MKKSKKKDGRKKHVYDLKIQELLHSDDKEMNQLGLTLLGFTGDNYNECFHLFEKYDVRVVLSPKTKSLLILDEEHEYVVYRKLPNLMTWGNYEPSSKDLAHENDFKYRKKFSTR